MAVQTIDTITYSIFDPTGNITALVETDVPTEDQPAVAASVMDRHPEVEQVGFIRFDPISDPPVHLRMAGGEFCGNATMCAAARYLARYAPEELRAGETVPVEVEGVREPVSVDLKACTPVQPDETAGYEACVHMPPVLSITKEALFYDGRSGELPFVREQGITHLVISDQSVFFDLVQDRTLAEKAIRWWCEQLQAESLGIMFIDESRDREADPAVRAFDMTPFVYVPGSDTVVWEQACASGAAACGIAVAESLGENVKLRIRMPGGEMRVAVENATGQVLLYGSVRLV